MKLFEKAALHFKGRPDPATGLRVLALGSRAEPPAGFEPGCVFRTLYHQHNPFANGGNRILLRVGGPHKGRLHVFANLETGRFDPVAEGAEGAAIEVSEAGFVALIQWGRKGGSAVSLADETGRVVNRFDMAGWMHPQVKFLEPRLLCIGVSQGQYYDEPVHSRFYLLDAEGGPPRLILDEQGYFCNHMMPRPGHPGEYAYDRWPTPRRREPVVTRLRTFDGAKDIPVPLAPDAQAVGPLWGGQRDHYLWAPDGVHLVSYFSTAPEGRADHFDFDWWVSRWNADTGREAAVPYPPERWGCNFAVSPCSRFIVTAGGRQFQNLYRIDLDRLAAGWNEEVLCAYPPSLEDGGNRGPFHMPHVLPDGSGAVFTAGWPGPADGAYLVEMPA